MKDKNVLDPVKFDENFWNEKYLSGDIRWDLGECSPPIKSYIDQLNDKQLSILIPGAGNAYEAKYLVQLGFKAVTVIDIAPALITTLRAEVGSAMQIIQDDFFNHQGAYDLVFEQTFFCALHPDLRPAYVRKMFDLLKAGGKLVGVLFNKDFNQPYPPFGGNEKEYRSLFSPFFEIKCMEPCYNSHLARKGNELFITLIKNQVIK